MRQKWTEILKVPPGLAGSSKICSRHFEDECFEDNKYHRKLKTNAKPTLFLGQNKLTYGKPESLIKEEVIEIHEVNDMPMLAENEVEEEYFNDTKYIKEEMLEVEIKEEESLDLIPSQQSIDLDLPATKKSKIDIQIDFDQENPEAFQKEEVDHKPPSSSVFLPVGAFDRKVEQEKLFFCQKCKKNFVSHGELREHISTHYRGKPCRGPEPPKFKCPHCVKLFDNESNLNQHVKFSHLFGPEDRDPFAPLVDPCKPSQARATKVHLRCKWLTQKKTFHGSEK